MIPGRKNKRVCRPCSRRRWWIGNGAGVNQRKRAKRAAAGAPEGGAGAVG